MIATPRTCCDPVDIWSNLDRVRLCTQNARKLFLFFDFDGTLAPIVSVPSLAMLSDELKDILRALATKPDVVPVIISGRSVDDLQRRVALPLIYVGNHGLEIRGRGLDYTVPEAHESRFQLQAVCNRLRTRLEPFAGALVECKRLSASVHVRQVEPLKVPAVVDVIRESIQHQPRFRIYGGKEVFEIRPSISWNKGSAARWIVREIDGEESDTICIGDDTTDEDLFAEFPSGISIRVGPPASTAARFRIEDGEVAPFLNCLVDAVEELRP